MPTGGAGVVSGLARRADLLAWARDVLLRGGWAPALVFAVHVVASLGFQAYERWPPLDAPMHFLGGVAIAWFFAVGLELLPRHGLHAALAPPLAAVVTVALTATAAVVWELAEFLSDRYFGTHAQLGLEDTLLDMFLGLAGGTLLAAARMVARGRRA